MSGWLKALRIKLRALFQNRVVENELQREMSFHLDMLTEQHIQNGMNAKAARKAALKEFGNLEASKERSRDSLGFRVVTDLIRDIGFALRNAQSTPGSSFLVVLIMAFGIGVSMTMFAFVKGVLWSEMGFPDEDRIVHIMWDPDIKASRTSPRRIRIDDYKQFEESNRTLESIIGIVQYAPVFRFGSADSNQGRIPAAAVTPNFFSFLSIPSLYGRTFASEDLEMGGEIPVVLSFDFWQSRFGGDLSILNATGTIGSKPARIIGIMPPKFSYFPVGARYWMGVDFYLERKLELPRQERRNLHYVLGKAKKGISYQQVESDFESIAARLAEEYPLGNDTLRGIRVRNHTADKLDSSDRKLLYTLLFCGILVLFVSSANVSNLMLARAARRSFELATRHAVGASKVHIMYQVVLDGFLLTLLGGILGLFFASFASSYVWNIYKLDFFHLPFWWQVKVDTTTIFVALGAMATASFLGSIIPAIRCARRDSFALLRDDSRTSSSLYMGRLSKILVGVQIAFALSLAMVATAMIFAQQAMESQEKTYDAEKLVVGRLWLGGPGYEEEGDLLQFQRNLRETMIEKGAQDVCFWLGGGIGERGGDPQRIEILGTLYDDASLRPQTSIHSVSPEYFDVYGLHKPLAGRLFTHADTVDSQPVAIVNQAFVETYFSQADPIGRQVKVYEKNGKASPWLQIVGVVDNYVDKLLLGETWNDYAMVYRPYAQNQQRFFTGVALKIRENENQWTTSLSSEMRKLAPFSMINVVRTLRDEESFKGMFDTLIRQLFGFFGIMSFIVASIGLYAVVSFSASQRVREFGVRMALGAHARDIIFSVAQTGIIQAILGLAAGITLGQALTLHLSESMQLVGLPSVWVTSLIAVMLILATVILSLLAPSLKATRLDPVKALRT